MNSDWRDGFLFIGNQLALDFLNTRLVANGQPLELFPDTGSLARWLAAAGLTTTAQAVSLRREWSTHGHGDMLQETLRLRESLRNVVVHIEAGDPVPAGFVKELNRLLCRYPFIDEVVKAGSGLQRRKRFRPERPQDLFAPLADAIARLLTDADPGRVRKCKACVAHFYDTSKKGTRMWCSMSLCGNRAKVAAYAGRRRAAGSASTRSRDEGSSR